MQRTLAILFFLGLTTPLLAQDSPQVEVFGGYQFNRQGSGQFALNQNGWNASVTGNINKVVGFTGDFGGFYKSLNGVNFKAYSYTFGPVVSFNHEGKVNPFVHALFGRTHFTDSLGPASITSNGFTMMYGGGADVKLSPRFAYRLIQADWVFYHFHGANSTKNLRLATGIVFRL